MTEREMVRLEVRRVIRAPRERVFDAWLDTEAIRKWWPSESFDAGAIVVDPREGGRYELGLQPKDGGEGFAAVGEYRTVDRPARLEFSWSWTHGPMDTVVTIRFEEVDDGTEVVLTHTGFPDRASRDQHEQGWIECTDRMKAVLT